jgi:hypothetical protein
MPQVCTKIKTSLDYQHIFKTTKYATCRELFSRLFSKPENSHPFGGRGSKSFKTPPPREARTSEQLGGIKTKKRKQNKEKKNLPVANQQETRQ